MYLLWYVFPEHGQKTPVFLNTVAEKICDIINPKYDSRIKLIKDISAGAVSFAVISSLIVLVIIYCPYFSDLLNNT